MRLKSNEYQIYLAKSFAQNFFVFDSTAFAVRFLNVAQNIVRLSVIPRNVTTPLAIAITNMFKGNVPIACVVVVLTGELFVTFFDA